MAIAGTGAMGKAMDNLRALVAASTTFRTWVGAADVAAALNRIYAVAVDTPTRPFALVTYAVPADAQMTAVAGGARHHFLDSGSLMLLFEQAVTAGTSHADAEVGFFNTVDAIISEMTALAASGTYFAPNSFVVEHGPVRSHPDEDESAGDYYQMAFRVSYGLAAEGAA